MEYFYNFFDPLTVSLMFKLFWAMIFGMVIGAERLLAHKTAGMRTYALVSMGSALFIIISLQVTNLFTGQTNFDPLRMAAQIIAGVGFLGAGLIMVKDQHITGLTSSTGLWVSAGIGMATGFGLYKISIITTVLTLFIFIVLWFIEQQLKKLSLFQKIEKE